MHNSSHHFQHYMLAMTGMCQLSYQLLFDKWLSPDHCFMGLKPTSQIQNCLNTHNKCIIWIISCKDLMLINKATMLTARKISHHQLSHDNICRSLKAQGLAFRKTASVAMHQVARKPISKKHYSTLIMNEKECFKSQIH